MAAKAEYKDYLNSTWQIRYDDLIQKSCGTIYSQLAKISLPPKTDEVKKWTEKDWAMHNAWLDLRAKPKTYDKPPRKRVRLCKKLLMNKKPIVASFYSERLVI